MNSKFLIIFIFFYIQESLSLASDDEMQAQFIVNDVSEEMKLRMFKTNTASWNHASNLTDENERINAKVQAEYAAYVKGVAQDLAVFDYNSFENKTLKRLIKFLTNIGDAKLSETDFNEIQDAVSRMQSTFAKVKVPDFKDRSKLVSLEPEITEAFAKSRNPEELKYYWIKWYDGAGLPNKKDFFKYVGLRNKAANMNGFKNGADTWLDEYEDPTFEKQIDDIMDQIKPLYMQLHGYVRHKLAEFYGPNVVDKTKAIPMHLLGNVWAQQWNIGNLVLPYKTEDPDIDSVLVKKNYTPLKMFQDSEQFFTSIGLSPMPSSFWEKSIIEKPNDGREMVCHASAWDFSINNDVRIKQCTRITFESYKTVHHEMGHIEYYLQYNHLPPVFRAGANPGFHEAVGDTIALSVATPKHMHRIGLLDEVNKDRKSQINQLLKMGIEKLPFLPFSYVFDKYRYEVFRGTVTAENANTLFWDMRKKHGGVAPPIERTNKDFDVTAKYHASADVEYLRYFVAFILQFQFHKASCIKAGEYEMNNPEKTLADCDIYQSKEAGDAIKKMLSLGSSVPWNDALEVITGDRQLDANALLEYFAPLYEWLKEENTKLNAHIGWDD
ncbi:hypothetical protein ACKWTF_009688 [Chironomus riparius]